MTCDHSEYSTSKDSMNQPWERIHQFTWCTISWFQIKMGWIWVSLSWAKQHETYIVRKTELATFSSLVFIGPILNNINYRHTDDLTGNLYRYISYKWFSSLQVAVSCSILAWSTPHFHNLNVLFLTMWISCCLSPNKPSCTQPLSIWN